MKRDAMRMRQRAAGEADVVDVPPATRLDVPQPGSSNFDQRVRETLMTYLGKQGNYLDRGLTIRDLIENGILTLPEGWNPGTGGGTPPLHPIGGGGGEVVVDLSPPPNVTGFTLAPGISVVFIETDPPTFTQGHGYLRTNIYGKVYNPASDPLPTFATAKFLFSFSGEVGSWATQPATTLRMWAKWETRDGVESIDPVGGTNGLQVTTGQDVTKLITAMTGPGKPFKEVTTPILLPDGTTVPVGVYISDAYIHRMQVVEAMINDLAVTNAKVKDLSASKIKAGSIAVGEYVRSSNYVAGSAGWNVNGAGSAEYNNVVVRGGVYASYGSFAGDISASTGTFNGGVRGGSYTGYAWPPAGQSGYFLGPGGLLLGNANNGSYFQIESSTGNVYAPQFNIVNGVASFYGSLNVSSSGGGDRMELRNNVMKIFASGVLRVQIGDLSA